ncbi:hypothetical protein HYS54_01680 [Candidatus Micrarchaeota archaeon]|nr:hypothetical protein [Candidatus Micrarchaeota archaeon]
MNMKGQVSGIDMLFSVAIFTTILLSAAITWTSAFSYSEQRQKDSTIEAAAFSTANQLVSYGGYPDDWDASNVAVIGLAKHPNVLDSAKLSAFASMNINSSKSLLGLERYGLHVRVFKTDAGGTNVSVFGEPPDVSATSIVVADSYSSLNGEMVVLRLTLWRLP